MDTSYVNSKRSIIWNNQGWKLSKTDCMEVLLKKIGINKSVIKK